MSTTSTLARPTTSRPGPDPATARPTAPTVRGLVGLEARKSLSTRSGRAVAVAAALIAPTAVGIALASGERDGAVDAPLAVAGMLTALVLLALGVLSTAGEWTHRTVQTTFLTEPRRGRVVAAKLSAMAVLGAALAAVSVGTSAAMMALGGGDLDWTGAGRVVGVIVAGGAAFAVIGAGIGAAVTNAPAALTGTYLVVLGVLPVVSLVRPALSEKLDPTSALVDLAQGAATTTPLLVLAGWLVLSAVAGTVVTVRRAVA